MRFKQLKTGIFVPQAQSGPSSWARRGLRAARISGNALLVAVQLVTVVILWKTYRDTVIPNRQKELLSEQVAELEIEKRTLHSDIAATRSRSATLDRELQQRRNELVSLNAQREQLKQAVLYAQLREKQARTSEAQAVQAQQAAREALTASQWSAYYERAAQIVNVPKLRMTGVSSDLRLENRDWRDELPGFDIYLRELEKVWPDHSADARLVASKLKEDEDDQSPKWMVDEFAGYFEGEAGKLACARPDFGKIRSTVTTKFKAASPHVAYRVLDEEDQKLRALMDECYDRFEKVADGFFQSKGAKQQFIPKAVREAFSDRVRRVNDEIRSSGTSR